MGAFSAFAMSFRSWFPSFSVMMKYQNKYEAAFTLSYVDIIQITARLFVSCFNTKSLTLIRFNLLATVLYGPLIVLLYLMQFEMVLVYSSIVLFSLVILLLYPSLYSLPSYFNQTITTENTSKMVTAYAIGEAAFAFLGGYLMEYIHPISLFFYLFMISLFQKYFFSKAIEELDKNKPRDDYMEMGNI